MLSAPYLSRVLVLAGLTSAATAGTGEFFANPEKMRPVYERIRAASPDKRVLVKVSLRDNLPVDTSMVAVRPVPATR